MRGVENAGGEGIFASLRRLEEAAGRQCDRNIADTKRRRSEGDHGAAVIGNACEIEPRRGCDQRLLLRIVERACAAHIDVEALHRRGDGDVERFSGGGQRACDGARGGQRLRHVGREQRAMIDDDEIVRAGRHEADLHMAVLAASRMERRATSARAMRVDAGFDRRVETRLHQGGDDEVALPAPLQRQGDGLRRAAAAAGEIVADGRDAVG